MTRRTTEHPSKSTQSLRGGVMAGAVGGAVIAVLMLAVSVANSRDIWVAMKGAGAPFLGARASAPGFDFVAVLVGIATHFAVSMAWGALFGVVVYGLSRSATVVLGPLFGVLVWLGMFYIVLPIIGLGEIAEAAPRGLSIFEHVVFGAAIGVSFAALYQRPARMRRVFV